MSQLRVMRLKGLKSVEIAPLKADGTVDESKFVEFGQTTSDSFVISKGEDTVTEEFIEETDEAVEELTTQKGIREITWSTKNVHADVFLNVAGGSLSDDNKSWVEDPNAEAKEVALRVTSQNGIQIDIARVKIRMSGDIKFSKNALTELTITAKQLATADGTSGFKITYPQAIETENGGGNDDE